MHCTLYPAYPEPMTPDQLTPCTQTPKIVNPASLLSLEYALNFEPSLRPWELGLYILLLCYLSFRSFPAFSCTALHLDSPRPRRRPLMATFPCARAWVCVSMYAPSPASFLSSFDADGNVLPLSPASVPRAPAARREQAAAWSVVRRAAARGKGGGSVERGVGRAHQGDHNGVVPGDQDVSQRVGGSAGLLWSGEKGAPDEGPNELLEAYT